MANIRLNPHEVDRIGAFLSRINDCQNIRRDCVRMSKIIHDFTATSTYRRLLKLAQDQ